MPERFAALIVGAGPAGSATALRLARGGHGVLMIDKARLPRDKCCSEYASPATLQEIAALGLRHQLDSRPWTALGGTTVVGPRGSQLSGRFADTVPLPSGTTGKALPRLLFDAMLHNAARDAGAQLRDATRLIGWQRRADGGFAVTLECDGRPEVVTARLIVGADGLRSRVARLAGLSRQGAIKRIAFVAHVQGVKGMNDSAELHVGRHGYLGLNPIDARTTNVAVVVSTRDATAARGGATAFFWQQVKSFPAVAYRVSSGDIVRKVLTTGPFDRHCRSSTADGIALVGDAADFFDPFTGEGIRSALVGARLLIDQVEPLLSRDAAITSRRLAGYRRARRQEFTGKWFFERVLGYAMLWPWLFDSALHRLHCANLGATMVGVAGGFVPLRRLGSRDALRALLRPGSTSSFTPPDTGLTSLG